MHDIQAEWELGMRQTRSYVRDLERGKTAAACVLQSGGSATQAILASLDAVFSPALEHSIFKDRVRAIMRRGHSHPEIRARYANYTERFPEGLKIDLTLWMIDMEIRYEKDKINKANRLFGSNNRPRIILMVLNELNLILRFMRRKGAKSTKEIK
jgi:hypothetical protein